MKCIGCGREITDKTYNVFTFKGQPKSEEPVLPLFTPVPGSLHSPPVAIQSHNEVISNYAEVYTHGTYACITKSIQVINAFRYFAGIDERFEGEI